ncbi:MAG: PAS domain S-box protein, partial [Syntrophorhabdaceae bacterium]|nr:PAS domain S-box protein [Syntrophorhabdaceae bacterium]
EINSFIQKLPTAIIMADKRGKILFCNNIFTEMLGYNLDEIPDLDTWFKKSLSDLDYAKITHYLKSIDLKASLENQYSYELKIICKDGSIKYVLQSGVYVVNRKIFIYHDLTDHKKQEELLKKNEAMLRSIFASVPLGILLTKNAIPIWSSESIKKLTGYTFDEIKEKGLEILFECEDDYNLLKNTIQESILRGEGIVVDTKITKSNKETIDLHLSAVPLDPLNPSKGTIITALDITAQKETERNIQENEEKYRTLFEAAKDAIILIDVNKDRIIECNDSALEMFHCKNEDIIGSSIFKFIPEKQPDGSYSKEIIMAMVKDVIKGKPKSFECRHIRPDRTLFDCEESLNAFKLKDSTIIMSIIRDITLRKEHEKIEKNLFQELENKNIELTNANMEIKDSQARIIQQEKLASIGQLAAGIAHEINNPMGFILSNLNTLKKYTERLIDFVNAQKDIIKRLIEAQNIDSKEIIEELSKKERSLKIDYIVNDVLSLIDESMEGGQKIKQIVTDLKTFSHADKSSYAMIDLNKIIESALNIVWNEIKYKATVEKDYGDIPPLMGNVSQIGQVLMNILVNAAQAIQDKGQINIKTWHDNDDIFIAISDTGHGIPKDLIGKIFEPFFTTKEVGKGTGLGLSIAYDIVRKHNGDITVDTEPGRGTTFTIRFPVKKG